MMRVSGQETEESGTSRPCTAKSSMRDGLYRVSVCYVCAGFIVKDGRVTECAPILHKNIPYWLTIAHRIAE